MHGRSANPGTSLSPFDHYNSIKRFGRMERENLTPSPDLFDRLRISSGMSDTGSLPGPGSPADWALSTRKLDDRASELARIKKLYETKLEKLEVHRCELDAWERKLSEWKRQMTDRHQTLEKALEEKIKSHNAQVLLFEEHKKTEREALQAEKDSFRRSRLQAASDLDEQRSVMRFRHKEFSEQEKSLGPRLAACEKREAELDQRETKLKAQEAEFSVRETALKQMESKLEELSANLTQRETDLTAREASIEELQKGLRVKLRESEKCLEELTAKEQAMLSQKAELDKTKHLLDNVTQEQTRRESELQDKEKEFKRREEELFKSLEEASWNIVESERELAEKSREVEQKLTESEELSRRLTKWSEELRVQNEKASIREKDLEAREEYLSKYFSAFQPI